MNHLHEPRGRLCHLEGRGTVHWRPTWSQLLALEPGLAVAEDAVALAGRPLRSAEWRTVEGLVARHIGLFGDHALHPVLGEMAAYEAAMEHLRGVSAVTRRPWRRRRGRR